MVMAARMRAQCYNPNVDGSWVMNENLTGLGPVFWPKSLPSRP
jgi:hypothetical protein